MTFNKPVLVNACPNTDPKLASKRSTDVALFGDGVSTRATAPFVVPALLLSTYRTAYNDDAARRLSMSEFAPAKRAV